MTIDNQPSRGSIHAKIIQADNVVSGVQFQGGDVQQASVLVNLTQAIRNGEISADEILARNLVSGLQYITDSTQASSEDLRQELVTLQVRVDTAIAAQEIPDEGDAEDVQKSLEAAEKELTKPKPNGERVLHKLDEVNKILTKSAELAQSTGKVGAFVIQLAPVAATVWQIAHNLFGL